MYNKEIKILNGLKCGYYQFRDKYHPLAYSSDNSVYLHRHLASIKLGRWINSEEHVHHIDGNKLNNSLDNLEILSRQEHAKVHNPTNVIVRECYYCGKYFTPIVNKSKYCSTECYASSNIKDKSITKELLDTLILKYSWTELGPMFGYSDNGIKKRAKALGCDISRAKYKKGQ